MTPLQAAVHQKLLETLPVRTHGELPKPEWVTRRAQKRKRPVVIFGKRYPSLKEAAEALGVRRSTIQYYLRTKKNCRYAK